jgi:hypothetical protein
MPFVEEEKMIKTKVIGIASKIDDKDTMGVRQAVIMRMVEEPESVSILYLRKRQVYVSFEDGKEFYLGDIKAKYEDLIMNNVTRIFSWQITGGYPIGGNSFVMAGQPTIRKHDTTAKYGLNIHVKLE